MIVAGALAGAALLHWHLWAGLVVEGALVLAVVLVGALHDRAGSTRPTERWTDKTGGVVGLSLTFVG